MTWLDRIILDGLGYAALALAAWAFLVVAYPRRAETHDKLSHD